MYEAAARHRETSSLIHRLLVLLCELCHVHSMIRFCTDQTRQRMSYWDGEPYSGNPDILLGDDALFYIIKYGKGIMLDVSAHAQGTRRLGLPGCPRMKRPRTPC